MYVLVYKTSVLLALSEIVWLISNLRSIYFSSISVMNSLFFYGFVAYEIEDGKVYILTCWSSVSRVVLPTLLARASHHQAIFSSIVIMTHTYL